MPPVENAPQEDEQREENGTGVIMAVIQSGGTLGIATFDTVLREIQARTKAWPVGRRN